MLRKIFSIFSLFILPAAVLMSLWTPNPTPQTPKRSLI